MPSVLTDGRATRKTCGVVSCTPAMQANGSDKSGPWLQGRSQRPAEKIGGGPGTKESDNEKQNHYRFLSKRKGGWFSDAALPAARTCAARTAAAPTYTPASRL